MVRIKKYIIPGAFLAFIFVMFGLYFLEAKPLDAKKYFDSEIHWKDQYIEIYGGVQKVLDKKTIEAVRRKLGHGPSWTREVCCRSEGWAFEDPM